MPVKQIETMNLGPTLTKSVEKIVALAKEQFGDPIDLSIDADAEEFDYWLTNDALTLYVPGDERAIKKLLKEAPDLLGYCIALDDLYPMEAVTPGWFFGEACYQAVADEVRRQLGIAMEVVERHPLK